MRDSSPLRWWPLLAIALAGCTRHTDTEVITLPCGSGQLIVHERYTEHIGKYSRARFELRLRHGKKARVVSALEHHVSLYARPASAGDHRLLRPVAEPPEDDLYSEHRPMWVAWVSPAEFSREEFEQIHQALARNLGAIDEALALRHPGPYSGDLERRPMLVAVEYIDRAALHKVYTGPDSMRIEVEPVGRVKMQRRDSPSSSMLVTGEIGLVTHNGERVLLWPIPASGSSGSWTEADIARCVDDRGRRLTDDFIVARATDMNAYRETEARIRDRESAFHELTHKYVGTFRHPVLPLELRIDSEGRVVVMGEIDGALMLRTVGWIVEGGAAILLPPKDARPGAIVAFLSVPGVPDRLAFVAECLDPEGHSPKGRYRFILAADEADYRNRLVRHQTGADRR